MSNFYFKDFDSALAKFREEGGAILFLPATSLSSNRWFVSYGDDVYEMLNEGLTIREVTEQALANGGLSQEQINQEMEYFCD